MRKNENDMKEKDFLEYQIWVSDDSDDYTIYPILNVSDFPDYIDWIGIKGIFSTPNGIEFEGVIMGIKNIFSIGIFCDGEIAVINKNLPEDWKSFMKQVNKSHKTKFKLKKFFPLKFVTKINLEGFKNFSGVFDLFSKITNEERQEL